MVEYDEAYIGKAAQHEVQKRLKRGKGSQNHEIIAVESESTPLEDPYSDIKSRYCGFFKMRVLKDVTKESVEQFVGEAVIPKSVPFPD